MSIPPYILRDETTFVNDGCDMLKKMIQKALSARGRCIIGLSGGKTPAEIYTCLGQDATIDWANVHVFLCDERYVPAAHADSNQRMIRSTLLMSADIPERNVHVPNTALPIAECVSVYDNDLAALLNDGADIVVLGIGSDGHTASLFPPLPPEALGPHFAIHTETLSFAARDRISVTLPVLTGARKRILFLRGRDKLEAWQEMTVDGADKMWWPIKAVMETGEMEVVVGK